MILRREQIQIHHRSVSGWWSIERRRSRENFRIPEWDEEVSLLIYSKCFLGASASAKGQSGERISFIVIQIVSQNSI